MSMFKPNAIVKTKSGKIGTTCYSGLDGVGIKYGQFNFDTSSEEWPVPDEIFHDPERELELIKCGSWEDE